MSADIFNDVLGPIMIGPSSSHTAGPVRIGLMARDLSEGAKSIRIYFSKSGSYAATYKGQGSDIGFVSGLLGWDTDDIRIPDALVSAKSLGYDFSFHIVQDSFSHPNTAMINFYDNGLLVSCLETISHGGAVVEIIKINGFHTKISGDSHEIIVYGKTEADDEEIHKKIEMIILRSNNDILSIKKLGVVEEENSLDSNVFDCQYAKQFTTLNKISDRVKDEIMQISEVIKVQRISPVLPVAAGNSQKAPFNTAKEMEDYYCGKEFLLWEAGLLYQKMISGWSEENIFKYCEKILSAMEESIKSGISLKSDIGFKFLKPKAGMLSNAEEKNLFMDTGILNKATVYATAVLENNKSMGKIVAAPTAGSSGVIPAILISIMEDKGVDRITAIKGLLSAGIIGVFIYNQATFAAEMGGCQAENGSSSAMAAAALTDIMGYDSKVSLRAAALSIQNMLGLICDPICGSVEIPCISRNVSAAANSVVSANMVIGGFDPYIPLDEVIIAMRKVGEMLPKELKCTVLGGLCETPTARKLQSS